MKKPDFIKLIYSVAVFALLFILTACGGKDTDTEASSERGSSEQVSAGTATEAASENGSSEQTTASTAEENSSESPSSEQDTVSTTEETTSESVSSEQIPVSKEIVLATFNIKHGAEGLAEVAEAIREVYPDIIGLEEVDVGCERSDYADEPAELARMAGYPYYAFAKAINLGDGEYGTALMSRYPIDSFEVIPLESGDGETRVVGHAVISFKGMKLDVFVTHLSYESRSLRITQMEAIGEMLQKCEHYALMGDLNSFNLEDISYLGGAYCVNRPDRSYITFRRREMAIDNIVVSGDFTEITSGVLDEECSDHKMLYAVFEIR